MPVRDIKFIQCLNQVRAVVNPSEQRLHRCARRTLREILNGVLDTFVIPELDWNILYEGVNNIAFTDLEDSYQYEVACRIASNYLITDNLNDYKNSDQTIISILSPVEFLSRVRGMTY